MLESQSILTRTMCCVSKQLQNICGAPADGGGDYCCGGRVLPDGTLEMELSSSACNHSITVFCEEIVFWSFMNSEFLGELMMKGGTGRGPMD